MFILSPTRHVTILSVAIKSHRQQINGGDHQMNKEDRQKGRATKATLNRLIEPLAAYICATDQPNNALIWALGILLDEVGQNNHTAQDHLAVISENQMG
jgi:hypothetical protein